MNVKPKKYLGQHFLLDNTVSQRIAEAIKIENKVNLLEIGPGTGALTQFLMGESINLIAYELDKESTIYLNENFPKLTVHNQDILKIEWKSIFNDNFSNNFNLSSILLPPIIANIFSLLILLVNNFKELISF